MLPEIQIPLPEQLPNESDSDYSLFLIYVRLPRPRIIKDMINKISDEKLLAVINYSHHYLIDMSSKNNWKLRADTYDIQYEQHIISLQQQHELEKATQFPEKEDKTIHALDLLKQRTITTLESKELFKPHELRNIAQALDIVQKGERLSNNKSTDIQKTNNITDIQNNTTTQQSIEIKKTETLLDDDFMKKQIEYGIKLIKKIE